MNRAQIRDFLLPSLWAWQRKVEHPLIRNIDLFVDDEQEAIYLVIDGARHSFLNKEDVEGEAMNDKVERIMREKIGEPKLRSYR